MLPILITFIVYGIILISIAIFAKRYTKNLSDYVLGGRSLSGPITALGAGASDMSSWLLMSLPGVVYLNGLSMIWMPVALLIGAYCNWKFIAKKLRVETEKYNNSLTLPAFLQNRFKDSGYLLKSVTSLTIITFVTFYCVAGFVSGAILIKLIFDIDYTTALLLSSSVIVIYTVIGGFLAVNWIDFFQGSLMLVSLLIVPIVSIYSLGGIENIISDFVQNTPNSLNFFNEVTILGVLSLFSWGLGYFGQPHINVRFMAIRSTKELPIARRLCMSWMLLSLVGAVATGLVGASYFRTSPLEQSDTVFIALSNALFNPWVAGILLSAILSAVMSTVSAQVLMTSSIIIEDFYHGLIRKKSSDFEYLVVSRIIVIIISCIAIYLASDPNRTIMQSVAIAWSGLGASFGPVLISTLYYKKMNKQATIAGILTGAITVLLWEFFVDIPGALPGLEMFPGFVLSFIVIYIFSKIYKNNN